MDLCGIRSTVRLVHRWEATNNGQKIRVMEKSHGQATTTEGRALSAFLDPLRALPGVQSESLGSFEIQGKKYSLPRFVFHGPNSSDPICLGLFAAIHGDEPSERV